MYTTRNHNTTVLNRNEEHHFYMTLLSLRATAKSPLHFAPTAQSSGSPSKSQHTSSTSEAVPPPTLSQNQSFSLPPGQAVCCFMDGGVGLYDMGAKKWDFLRDLVLHTVTAGRAN